MPSHLIPPNLWLTDAGNARVLRFPYSAISGNNVFGPDADTRTRPVRLHRLTDPAVPGTNAGRRIRTSSTCPPPWLRSRRRLYMANYNPGDPFNTSRVLVFDPRTPGKSASRVIGVFPEQAPSGPAPSRQAISPSVCRTCRRSSHCREPARHRRSGFGLRSPVDLRSRTAVAEDEATSFSPVAKGLVGHATGIAVPPPRTDNEPQRQQR